MPAILDLRLNFAAHAGYGPTAVAILAAAAYVSRPDSRPNLVWITVDGLRPDRLTAFTAASGPPTASIDYPSSLTTTGPANADFSVVRRNLSLPERLLGAGVLLSPA